jgi:hypothetical protein
MPEILAIFEDIDQQARCTQSTPSNPIQPTPGMDEFRITKHDRTPAVEKQKPESESG